MLTPKFKKFSSLLKGALAAVAVGLSFSASAGNIKIQNGQSLIFMGDSLTEYGEMMPWGYTHLVTEGLKANGVTVTWDGVGIRGQQASQMLARFDTDVFANENIGKKIPNVVMIASGANDIGGGVSCDTYIANMMAMADKVRAKGSTPILASPTASSHNESNDDGIATFAHALRTRAEKEGIACAPWYEMYREYVDDPETVVLTPFNSTMLRATCDGCHMAPAGDRVLALATLKAFGLDMDQLAKAEETWNSQKLVTLVPVTYGAANQSITVSLTSSEASQVSTLDALQAAIERGAASLAANPTLEEPASGASVNKTISQSLNPSFTFKTYDQLIIAARKLGIRVDQAVQCAILRGVRGGTVPAASAPVASVEEVLAGVTTARFQAKIESVGGSAGACDAILKYGTSASSLDKTQRIAIGKNAPFISDAIEGLASDTTYYYELTFQNNASTVKSTKVSGNFRTRPIESVLAPSGDDDTSAIQAAIDAAASSKGTVRLDSGVFQLDGELTLSGGVTLKGNGMTQTILHERGAHRVLQVKDGSKLVGVTVEGGKVGKNWEEGGGMRLLNGTVSQCRVWHNNVWGGNNFGGGIYVESGTIDHSIIAFNSTSASSSGAAGIGASRKSGTVVIDTCLVYGNTTEGNGAGVCFNACGQDVTIRNSTIAGNIAANCGGLYLNGSGNVKLENSVVSGNVSGDDVNPVGSLKKNSGNVIGNASFADAAAYDFHLSAGDTVGYYADAAGGGEEEDDPGTTGGDSSGHEGVQLWANGPYFAKTNLGAEKETDVGCYYRFGETVGAKYTGSGWVDQNGKTLSSTWYNGGFTHTPASGTLPEQYDAAHALWGGSWRMMTAAERDGLKNKCDWAWTTISGVSGMKFTGRGAYSGNSIFLPDGGWSGGPTPSGCAYYFTGEASGSKPCSMRFGTTYIALETVHNGDKAYPVRAVSSTAPGPSHTHTWGTPSYEWKQTASGYSCTATAVCTADGSHKLTKTVAGVYQVTKEATTSATGTGRYTATFTDAPFTATKTYDVEIPKLHVHAYGTPTYSWVGYLACSASASCTVCTEKKTEQGTVTSVTTPATCTAAGKTVYTAAFATFASTTKTESLPAGHVWGTPSYVWSADGSNCTATVACTLDPSHVKTETVLATFVVTRQPTTRKTGLGHMVAVLTQDPFTPQNGPDVEIPMKEGGAATGDWYVSTTGSDSADGTTPETAFATIDKAVGVAQDGDIVCVLAGTYEITSAISLAKSVTILGETGDPADVVIRNVAEAKWPNDMHRVAVLNHAGAVISGVTVEGGVATHYDANAGLGANVLIDSEGGTLMNCIVRNGRLAPTGQRAAGAGVACRSASGLISHCVITNNVSVFGVTDVLNGYTTQGAACGVYLKDGVLRDSLIAGNTVSGITFGTALYLCGTGTVENCTIADNRAVGDGDENYQFGAVHVVPGNAAATTARIRNCAISRNLNLRGENISHLFIGNMNPAEIGYVKGNYVNCVTDGKTIYYDKTTDNSPYMTFASDLGLTSDYHPASKSSPLVDAGAEMVSPVDTDLDGNDRVSGAAVDVGCYEFGSEPAPTHTHAWGEPTYTWSADGKSCTATRACTGCTAKESETAKATFVTTKEATTEATGLGHYEASFKNSAFAKQSGADVTIPKKPVPGAGLSKSVTFTVSDKVASTLSGFPLLVKLAANSPVGFAYADCADDGGDLRFFDADGEPIPFEIDTWNPAGESLVWVKVPSYAAGTTFTLQYGGESDVENDPTMVWSDYTGVWHLNGMTAETDQSLAQSQGVYANSTAASGIDGHVSVNSVTNQEGRFGTAFKVNDATTYNASTKGGVWVNDSGTGSPLDADGTFTISGWFKHQNMNFYWDHPFAKRDYTNPTKGGLQGAFSIEMDCANYNSTVGARGVGNTPKVNTTYPTSLNDGWSYLTFVYEGTTCTVYQNGVLVTSGTINEATDNDAPLVFGNTSLIAKQGAGDAPWQGWIDEVRYLKAAKSAEWIAAEYTAMTASGLYTAGEVEDIEVPVPPTTVDWDHPEVTIAAGVTAGTAWSALKNSALAAADAAKLQAWAKNVGKVAFESAGDIKLEAFLLNCANTDAAIATAKAEFKFTAFDPEKLPTASDFADKGYNGVVTIEGRAALDSGDWATAKTGDHFFRAVLSL